MTRLLVGCVGLGFIGGRHLLALDAMPHVEIVAVADPVADRARAVAEKFGARSYDDGVKLINNEVLDAVWLCLPPFAHGPAEQAAVERALPFFVEKPLAHDLDTATTISEQVDQLGLLTAVGYHWRHLSIVGDALRRLQDAPPQLITGCWLDTTPAVPWWSRRNSSGGQLVEQTTHVFDLARLLVGEVHTVTAVESRLRRDSWPEADVPTASTAVLQFTSGAIGSTRAVACSAVATPLACRLSRRTAFSICTRQACPSTAFG